MSTHTPVSDWTPIAIKVSIQNTTKKFKMPLKHLGADKLIPTLRLYLLIDPGQAVVFERYSDSAGGYVVLDPANPAVFKTLVRAAKAKLKLRLRATLTPPVLDQSAKETLAHLESLCTSSRGSTAFDQRSVGTGIFQFRQPTATPSTEQSEDVPEPDEALVSGTPKKDVLAELEAHGLEHDLALRTRPNAVPSSWVVYCNKCDAAMDDVHFHCSVCDGGDYDLCQSCVDDGSLCPGDDHWLIKRTIDNGKIVASTTERLGPKKPAQSVPVKVEKIDNISTEREMPGAFTDDARTLTYDEDLIVRTCNNCIEAFPDREFVTCTSCDDFDLCRLCIVGNKHGHHPAHRFVPTLAATKLPLVEEAMLHPGRNVRHRAICDGCDQNIFGVRHKCFECPDFDYCDDCIKDARKTHPRHRFAPIYDVVPLYRISPSVTHHGIYCDGALCTDKPSQSYIEGVRYKCVVCDDVDFCATCEASPLSTHNKTHPLIKFKTPVKHVTISTENADRNGTIRRLGDAVHCQTPVAHATAPVKPVVNATAPVKTVADFEPAQTVAHEMCTQNTEVPKQRRPFFYSPSATQPSEEAPLEAHFVRDSVVDGTSFAPDTRFAQVWTLRNPGPRAWPSGCSVRFVGGDNMLNYDSTSALSDINEATESNVTAREVQVGEEVSFRVLLKAPSRVGKSISYWRLKSAEGMPFGHKLWCDINIAKVEIAKPATQDDLTAAQKIADQLSFWEAYQDRMSSVRLANARTHSEQRVSTDQTMQAMDRLWLEQQKLAQAQAATAVSMLATQIDDDVRKADLSFIKTTPEPAATSQQQTAGEAEMSDSQMVFPTLVKESPSNSKCEERTTAKPAFVEDEETGVKITDAGLKSPTLSQVSASAQATEEQEEEAFDDISELEVLSADGESSDDGFMTDEEYDILDASDQETVASK